MDRTSASISDRKQPYRRVLETVLRNLSEIGTLMMNTLAGRSRRNGWNEEEMLDIIHDNQSTSDRYISSETGWLYQRTASRTLRDNKLYPSHLVQPMQGLYQVTSCPQFSRRVLRKTVCTPQFLCRGKAFLARNFGSCNDLIIRIQTTATDILPGQLYFINSSIWRHCEACV